MQTCSKDRYGKVDDEDEVVSGGCGGCGGLFKFWVKCQHACLCGVAWCGVVWCGVVWSGVVWCGVVWCGVVL